MTCGYFMSDLLRVCFMDSSHPSPYAMSRKRKQIFLSTKLSC